MDFDDYSSSSSLSSSCNQLSPPSGLATACSSATSLAPEQLAPPKRKAGRKKFRETRHPVYHGVRRRDGGRWVCEVREPRTKGRIWLGTHRTPEMAARAHDVAAIALRGESAQLNFRDSAWALPRARSAASEDVRRAAAEAAEMFQPSNSPPRPSTAPPAGPTAPPGTHGREAAGPAVAPVFVDEEELFNMPGLLEEMARGLLVTPPAIRRGFDWDREDENESVADMSLWKN